MLASRPNNERQTRISTSEGLELGDVLGFAMSGDGGRLRLLRAVNECNELVKRPTQLMGGLCADIRRSWTVAVRATVLVFELHVDYMDPAGSVWLQPHQVDPDN